MSPGLGMGVHPSPGSGLCRSTALGLANEEQHSFRNHFLLEALRACENSPESFSFVPGPGQGCPRGRTLPQTESQSESRAGQSRSQATRGALAAEAAETGPLSARSLPSPVTPTGIPGLHPTWGSALSHSEFGQCACSMHVQRQALGSHTVLTAQLEPVPKQRMTRQRGSESGRNGRWPPEEKELLLTRNEKWKEGRHRPSWGWVRRGTRSDWALPGYRDLGKSAQPPTCKTTPILSPYCLVQADPLAQHSCAHTHAHTRARTLAYTAHLCSRVLQAPQRTFQAPQEQPHPLDLQNASSPTGAPWLLVRGSTGGTWQRAEGLRVTARTVRCLR